MASDLEDAIGTPLETSAKLDHTLQAYGRLERRHYEIKRENKALREALERIARDAEESPMEDLLSAGQIARSALASPSS